MDGILESAGGRAGARRLLVTMALVACATTAAPAQTQAPAGETPTVTVREAGGIYTVAARFHVAQPSSIAFAVLTDYEAIPEFMPDVKTSRVRERFPDGALIEQEAVARVMMFSKRVHLLLEVRAEEDTVTFRDACGRSFLRYEGAWRLTPQEHYTLITYELEAQPKFDVPRFLLTRLLRRDSNRMIERLRSEIAARAR